MSRIFLRIHVFLFAPNSLHPNLSLTLAFSKIQKLKLLQFDQIKKKKDIGSFINFESYNCLVFISLVREIIFFKAKNKNLIEMKKVDWNEKYDEINWNRSIRKSDEWRKSKK